MARCSSLSGNPPASYSWGNQPSVQTASCLPHCTPLALPRPPLPRSPPPFLVFLGLLSFLYQSPKYPFVSCSSPRGVSLLHSSLDPRTVVPREIVPLRRI